MSVIEHRSAEGVLGAFESVDNTKFAIGQGTEHLMVYDGTDKQQAIDQLEQWLNFIQEGGSKAIYKLKIYPDTVSNITNKTPHTMATRFQLSASDNYRYENTPDGKGVMVIRDRGQAVTPNNNNAFLQQILDQNTKLLQEIQSMKQTETEKKLDAVIGSLNQAKEEKETWEEKLIGLGKALIDNPEIVDRVGYIFRPSIYSRESVQVNGTQNNDSQPTTKQSNMQPSQELTQEEIDVLDERQNKALDILEEKIGLHDLTEALEKLAVLDEKKLQQILTFL